MEKISIIGGFKGAIKNIHAGEPVVYKIRFPRHKKFPQITGILMNGEYICGRKEDEDFTAGISMKYLLTTYQRYVYVKKFRSYTEVVDPRFNRNLKKLYRRKPIKKKYDSFSDLFGQVSNPGSKPIDLESSKIKNKTDLSSKSQIYSTINKMINTTNEKNQTYSYKVLDSRTNSTGYSKVDNIAMKDMREVDSKNTNSQSRKVSKIPSTTSNQSRSLVYPNTKYNYNATCNGEQVIQRNPESQDNSPTHIKEICGIPGLKTNSSNVGELIQKGSFPWIVVVLTDTVCNGNLISSKTVITAAHCINLGHRNCIPRVSVGTHSMVNNERKNLYFIDKIYVHPDYKEDLTNFDGDIAVIITKIHIQFTDYIRPSCLWTEDEEIGKVAGETAVIIGWAILRGFALNNLTAIIAPNEECIKYDNRFEKLVSNRTFCAKNVHEKGPCDGHSGSGLLVLRNGRWTLRGTVSGVLDGKGHTTIYPNELICKSKPYIVYADVAKFMPWILSLIVY